MEKFSLFKKIIVLILSLIIAGGIFSIIYFVGFKDNSGNKISLEIKKTHLTTFVGETIDLKDYYTTKPLNISTNVLCLADNSSLVTIDDKNILTAKGVGETIIYLKVNSGNDILQENIFIQIDETLTIPQNLSFDYEKVSLMMGDTTSKNKLTIKGDHTATAKIEFSTQGVCEYNITTGIITPKSVGKTLVTISFENNNETISESFEVEVKSTIKKEIILTSKNLTLENDGYHLSLSSNQIKSISIAYSEDNIEIDSTFEISILSNSCGLETESERNSILISTKSSGNAIIEIKITGKNKSILLFVERE